MAAPAFQKFNTYKIPLAEGLVIRKAIIQGDYLHGRSCRVIVSPAGKILDSDLVHCAWSGREKFDAWFRENYNPFVVIEPAG